MSTVSLVGYLMVSEMNKCSVHNKLQVVVVSSSARVVKSSEVAVKSFLWLWLARSFVVKMQGSLFVSTSICQI